MQSCDSNSGLTLKQRFLDIKLRIFPQYLLNTGFFHKNYLIILSMMLKVVGYIRKKIDQIRSDQSLSRFRLSATPWITARQASLSITNSRNSLRLTSIKSVMPSSHLILCRHLFLLPPIPPRIRVFSNESTFHMRCPKYWSFSFSIIPSKEIPGLISFRMDWLDLLAVQGTLKSLSHVQLYMILWTTAR